MKKILFLLSLGISCVSFAAVVPTEPLKVRRPSVTRPDATKMKMMVKKKVLNDTVGKDAVQPMQRYSGVVTMDNVKALENMSRLMQDNPNALMQQLGVTNMPFEVDLTKTGTDEIVPDYVPSPETDDPAEKLGGLHVPELTGSFDSMRSAKTDLRALHQQALKQIEDIGQGRLGQKMAPIQMPMTVEEIKASGIDTRRLPRDWEKIVKQSEESRRLYQEQEARKKAEKAKADAEQKKQQQTGATQQEQKVQTQQGVSKSSKSAAKPVVKSSK